ncbi:MAG: VCBS repeat-containing protein, partial [Daejeonella sp.]
IASKSLFTEITSSLGIDYKYKDQDFIDFNIQKLMPHKFSQYPPALAVGDLDGNGLEDMVVGGAYSNPAKIFLQNTDGRFTSRNFTSEMAATQSHYQDLGILVFDADNDKDLDVYMASGGYENAPNSSSYQDKLYLNDGKGNFQLSEGALPKNYTSKFCVRASDYDRDGDLDLFVSGRVDPWNYPKPVSSYIFRNDSKNGKVKFTDVTHNVAAALTNVGMVCDAVFSDFDNDGWEDLIVAGEWMPVTFLKNNKGTFSNVSQSSGVYDKKGWWNTIAPGDFDNDGDIDYIIGNQGDNTFYKASEEFPTFITAKDFDNNGSFDAIPSLFLPDQTGKKKEFPAHTRDDMVKQIISTRVKYQNYKSYATATMDDIFPNETRNGALRLKANYLLSGFFRNDGGGKFTVSPLPVKAQVSVLNGIAVDDFDGDGNLDAVINGNDFGTEVSIGRYDALNGLFLKGNGKGEFKPLSILESGIFIPGNGKALVKLKGANGKYLLAASQNRGPLKVFNLKTAAVHVPVKTTDKSALIQFADGRLQKREFYFGSSFLSQSSRALDITSKYRSVTITDVNGKTRKF